jgi:hypothetical protein
MAKKIAKVDAENMNSLYAAELEKLGAKVAAKDDTGQPKDIQAFQDHEDYLGTLEAAFKEDKKAEGSFDPNDKIQD